MFTTTRDIQTPADLDMAVEVFAATLTNEYLQSVTEDEVAAYVRTGAEGIADRLDLRARQTLESTGVDASMLNTMIESMITRAALKTQVQGATMELIREWVHNYSESKGSPEALNAAAALIFAGILSVPNPSELFPTTQG